MKIIFKIKKMKRNFSFNMFRILKGNDDSFYETKFNKTFKYNKENSYCGNIRKKNKGNLRLIITPDKDNHFSTTTDLKFVSKKKKIINKKIQIVNNKSKIYFPKEKNKEKENETNIKELNNYNEKKKIKYNFKNIKIVGNKEINEKNQNSDSTISHLSIFNSLNPGRKSSSLSIDFTKLLANNDEVNDKKKQTIDQESFEKFYKNINDLLNLN